ncbi:MAG: DUF4833 domain-containing protein [Spirosomataceae bacterium]
MYFKKLLFVVVVALSCSGAFAQKDLDIPHDKLPVPPTSPVRLFIIQRNTSTNTVVYDANMLPNKKLNPDLPVRVYWLRYAEKGQRQDLSTIQRTLAYGYEFKSLPKEPGSYDFNLISYRKRRFKITLDEEGNPMALFPIAGRMQKLHRIYVRLEEDGHLFPKVLYVELFGKDPKTGADAYERFKP